MRIFRRFRRKKPRSAAYNKRARRRLPFFKRDPNDRTWMKLTRLGMTFLILGLFAMVYVVHGLPDIYDLQKIKKEQAITVETADGRIVATYGDVYGAYVPYEKIPKPLIEAVVATEDRRFFVHHGVDFYGIARAMAINIYHRRVVQGGSTITQQVAKNLFLTPRRSIERKLQEILIAFWLEGRYSKQEILAIYLNRVYLGGGTFGIDAASRRYFNKPATDLSLLESAMLAGLLKAPSHFSPTANVERARERATVVLNNMVDAGFIKQKDVVAALATFKKDELHSVEGNAARYFTDWVVDDLQNYVTNTEDDLVVTTTLDPKLQDYARDAVENIVATEGAKKKVTQGALVAMEPGGAVKAMIGGTSYAKSQYNRAAQAKRQPGSVFKLFVYLAALEAGYTPNTTVLDAPVIVETVGSKDWAPDNFTGDYKGELPMWDALRQSLNTVSVRLSQYTGVDKVANMAMRLGIPDVPAYASIAVGAATEVTLLELTGAYAHLDNHGNKVVPYGILSVRTAKGDEIYKREAPTPEPVLATGTVEMMNYMLIKVACCGTGARSSIGRPVAGKTGTSSDFKDAWFVGFTPQLVTGTWVGNDNNTKMVKVTGGSLPAGIWHDFMIKAMADKKVESIPNSEGSSEGMLPWLFGGSNTENPQPEEGAPAMEQPSGDAAQVNGVPQDVEVIRQAPIGQQPSALPWQQAAPETQQAPQPAQQQPQQAQPQPQAQQQDVLTPGFWDKLMKHTPKLNKVQVEHTYPNSAPHRKN